jgi:acyl carrier protein
MAGANYQKKVNYLVDQIVFKRGDISMGIIERLEKFLLTEIAADLGRKSLVPDEDLLEQGIIDSLGILKLILFIEETYGIKIIDEEIVPENFQTLNVMVKFVEQKKLNS